MSQSTVERGGQGQSNQKREGGGKGKERDPVRSST